MTEMDVVLSVLEIIACVFAAIPAALTWQNLKIFCTSPQAECSEPVTVLVPARNEEQVLDGFIRNILASRGVQLELVVLEMHYVLLRFLFTVALDGEAFQKARRLMLVLLLQLRKLLSHAENSVAAVVVIDVQEYQVKAKKSLNGRNAHVHLQIVVQYDIV